MARFGTIGDQFSDDSGNPLVNGKLEFFESGTTTQKNTYADINLTIPNTNPVILTGAGRQPNIFFDGSARVVLSKNDDTQIEVRDPIGSSDSDGVFSSWNALTTYNTSNIVEASDGLFYISITDGNQGNDPTSSPANWTEIRFTRQWNVNESYSIERIVAASNGLLYKSVVNNNLGNDPILDTTNTNWEPAVNQFLSPSIVDAKLTLKDDKTFYFGDDEDFVMYIDSATDIVNYQLLTANGIFWKNAAGQDLFAADQSSGYFFYEGALKLFSTASGANVNGLLFATGDLYENSASLVTRYVRMDAQADKTNLNNGDTLVAGNNSNCDTTTAAFTLNLPASPSVDDKLWFRDVQGNWATNNLTVGRNGQLILNSATDLVLNVDFLAIGLIFTSGGWAYI